MNPGRKRLSFQLVVRKMQRGMGSGIILPIFQFTDCINEELSPKSPALTSPRFVSFFFRSEFHLSAGKCVFMHGMHH